MICILSDSGFIDKFASWKAAAAMPWHAGAAFTVMLKGNKSFMLGTPEIILIVLVVLLLFGGKKIPELMKGLGKGVKSFKDGVNGIADEPKKPEQKKEE